jgi:nucleotide-binding universal stress UspA family protein
MRLLVATDGSPGAERAVEVASRIATATEGKLWIVTVGGELTASEKLLVAADSESQVRETLFTLILMQACDRARALGVAFLSSEVVYGDPGEAILKVIDKEKIHMVFVGRRGRSPLTSLLLGSVSMHLVMQAHCSVTVVP